MCENDQLCSSCQASKQVGNTHPKKRIMSTSKRVRSDNGSEFKNTRIDELCNDFAIRHQFSAKYTPQSNDLVERENRTLIDMARSMLSEYNVSHSFWAKAINMSCYYSNQLCCHPMMEKTPYELLNGRKPNIAYFSGFWL